MKSASPDIENISVRSSTSVNNNVAPSEKAQSEGTPVADSDKNSIQQIEHEANGDDASTGKANVGIPLQAAIVKPSLRETLLAWSPWISIVLVVIM